MKITKNLIVKSIDDFHKLIDKQYTLLESSTTLMEFTDVMFDYYHGCQCLEDEYANNAKNLLSDISQDEQVLNLIKNYFECDKVIFNLK